jgi:hypothetical protein
VLKQNAVPSCVDCLDLILQMSQCTSVVHVACSVDAYSSLLLFDVFLVVLVLCTRIGTFCHYMYMHLV